MPGISDTLAAQAVTFEIERLEVTQLSDGSQLREYSTGNRDALPTELDGVPILMTQQERMEYGVRGDKLAWKFISDGDGENPLVDARDRVTWTDHRDEEWTARVTARSYYIGSPTTGIFQWLGEEVSTEVTGGGSIDEEVEFGEI